MKSIIFNTEMVKAISECRKTSFRLPIKLKDNSLICTGYIFSSTDRKRNDCYSFGKNKEHDLEYIKPKYKIDDILYVKETFQFGDNIRNIQNIPLNKDIEVLYYEHEINNHNSNHRDFAKIIKWKPSIHMPKKHARIFLKVTNARVERLQDISFDDMKNEGIDIGFISHGFVMKSALLNKWKELWNSTLNFHNGIRKSQNILNKYNWEDNPYVFVYEFERIEK